MPTDSRRSWTALATLCALGLVATAQACSKDLDPTPITVHVSGIPAASEALNVEIVQAGSNSATPQTHWLSRVTSADFAPDRPLAAARTVQATVSFLGLNSPGAFAVAASSTVGSVYVGFGTSTAQFDGGPVQVELPMLPGAAVACDPTGGAACAAGLSCGRYAASSTAGFCTLTCADKTACASSPLLKEATGSWACGALPIDAVGADTYCLVQCDVADGGTNPCPNGLSCGQPRGAAGHHYCEP